MSDEINAAHEAADEVVQPEAEQVEAAEAPESTEGQDNDQPASDEADAESTEEMSESKKRRERRKAKMRELREAAQEAEKREQAANQRLAKIREASQGQKPPKEDDFQDYQEYLVASGAWYASQEMDRRAQWEIEQEAEASKRELDELRKREQADALENWESHRQEARSRYADFDAVVSAPDLPISQGMAQMIYTSEAAADVAYHLGKNRELTAYIAQLPPIEQARELGRIEASLSRPSPRTTPSAPDPVKPVRPRSSGHKDPAKMTMAEYAAARKAGKL